VKKLDKPLEEFRAALVELDWDSGPVITLSRVESPGPEFIPRDAVSDAVPGVEAAIEK
jgi:hypothetical protein